MTTILVLLGIVLFLLLVGVLLWRFFYLRSEGYPVLLRALPAEEARHWRHGVLVYSRTSARLYKLRSLRPGSDLVLTRLATTVESRRDIVDRERPFIEGYCHVMKISHRGEEYEIAIDDQGDNAFVSWLESAPSERWVRTTRFS
ncbi:DUF2550 domain-containing protein [Corynebacterium urealyticum]|uniref:DUF2550 domain-containing protein n=1 Tax=Corynebacterium urealyticum TaxID=43771 RepID=UPI00034B6EB6|nr:DUF2550 domain-containing protein [Corynebacterium urealyticum]SNV80120.1 putative secreted protein [Corynebacterium urealyticum]